jgi:hypothetical protein
MASKEFDESYSDIRARVMPSDYRLCWEDQQRAISLFSESTPRILTDEEAGLFGWEFEEDEQLP